ncbi:MAG: NADH-quinone oxidoreductase subunit NuoE [Inquilinus sp.]|nr:NADH-quinone oxidoreductase subunit NuoE [Inquilinus sp.]
MSFGAPAPESQQPDGFVFSAENLKRAKQIIARYPSGRQQSALLPLLDLAQRQNENWLPRAAMDYVAELLEIPPIRAYEVASFYTMFNKAPVGRHFIQVCTTTPCWLCGSADVLKAVKDETGLAPGGMADDGSLSVIEVECLGACVNAPMVQVNDDYYEDLSYDRMVSLIRALKAGEAPKVGSQTGRKGSQALSGPTSLLDPALAVGAPAKPKASRPKAEAKSAEKAEPEKAEADKVEAEKVEPEKADPAKVEAENAESEKLEAPDGETAKGRATAKTKPRPPSTKDKD